MKTFFLFTILITLHANATRLSAPPIPVAQCYHWLTSWNDGEDYLAFKYRYAEFNEGELSFYTDKETSHGSVAGEGLYCGKSIIESFAYGQRVIKIEFVNNVIIYDKIKTKQNYCGTDGRLYKSQAECNRQTPDVIMFAGAEPNGYAYYVIKNPKAIKKWTTNSRELIQELNNGLEDLPAVVERRELNEARAKIKDTLEAMIDEQSRYPEISYINKRSKQPKTASDNK